MASPYFTNNGQMMLGTRKVRLRWVVADSENWPGPDWYLIPDPIRVTAKYYYRGVWHQLDFGAATHDADGWVEFEVSAPRRGIDLEVKVAVGLEGWWFARLMIAVPSVVADDGRNATPLRFEVPGEVFQPQWSATPGGDVTAAAVNAAIAAAIAAALAGLPTPLTQAQVDSTVAAAIAALPAPPSQSDIAQVVTDALAALPAPLTQADVDAAVAAAIAALPPSITQAEVDQAVADALAALPPVVFTDDKPVTVQSPLATQTSAGEQIGLNSDGTLYSVPDFVGAMPVVIDGKKYLIPLMEA